MLFENRHQAQDVQIISNAKVAAHFVLFDIFGADGYYNFRLVRKLHQHTHLAVRLKARKYAGCVVIVEKLSPEFQVKFVVELADSFDDMCGLCLQVFFVVKSYFHVSYPSCPLKISVFQYEIFPCQVYYNV